MSNPFAGTWTYRSFLNNPEPVGDDPAKLKNLLFAEGELTVQDAAPTVFKAALSFGPGNIMELNGVITPAEGRRTAHAHIVGAGQPGGPLADYFYDYDGSLTEEWPNGVNQVPAITGSVIRARPHGGKPAGVVASFVAVKAK